MISFASRLLVIVLVALPIWPWSAASVAAASPSPANRPNIVLILSDDMGYADIGAHGCQDIPTPHIDRLAAQGVRFTNAYANGSFCTPTRAALMSGRYQQRSGNEDLTNVTGPLPQAVKTLPDRLRAAGYTTGMVGKWHLGEQPGFTPLDRGFDDFFGFLGGGHVYLPAPQGKGEYAAPLWRNREPLEEQRYLTDAFGEEAAAFVERQRANPKPFFLYLAFNAVHTPLQAPDRNLSQNHPSHVGRPGKTELPTGSGTGSKDVQRFLAIDDSRRRTYAAMLSAMDDAIGLVLDALQRSGKLEQTLVIFHNDNGGPTTRNAVNGSRNTPLRGSKCETFEGGIRVPLLMRWPAVLQPGAVYRHPVITMDLSATAVALAGAEAAGLEGVNLLPFVTGQNSAAPHDALYWRSRTRSNNYAVRQGDWKYVYSTEGDASPGPKQTRARDMLFNLADDLAEQHDLAAKHPEKLAALKQLYEAWSASVDADCRALGIEPSTVQADVPPVSKPKRKAKP